MWKLPISLLGILFSFVLTFAGVSQADEPAKGASPAAECPHAKKGATGEGQPCPHATSAGCACDKAACPCQKKDGDEAAKECPCKSKSKK
jgi:hypothetical protein